MAAPGFDWDEVRAIPGVEALGRFVVSSVQVDALTSVDVADFAYADASVMDTIERPVVLVNSRKVTVSPTLLP